ncbi:monooxygenase [Aureobasidium pullulans]|nr:monooxygenase [Aureobasidium pullulans]
MAAINAIIIGAGPSGIAMGHKMKHELGFEDFTIYEKLDGVGGTWRTNTYPGCFNLNPNWSKQLAEQAEILQYIKDTVDKFDLRKHVHASVECLGAKWDVQNKHWAVTFRDLTTDIVFIRTATMLISAVGGISAPRDAVIGNGCSAVQVIPAIAKDAKSVKQYARSPLWYHERPNRHFSNFEKWSFRWVPFLMRLHRWNIFWSIDKQSYTYRGTDAGVKQRLKEEEEARQYIYTKAPEKYHNLLVPDFELGCKRKIADPEYLDSLNRDNVELIPEGLQRITEDGIISTSGRDDRFDIIVTATGFKVSQFLTPMDVIGANGSTLEQQWKENRGAQAYLGTFVHNFPNMAIL